VPHLNSFALWAVLTSNVGPNENLPTLLQSSLPNKTETITRDVSHCGLFIYIKKYLKAKEEL
jgi:hypothetical protein